MTDRLAGRACLVTGSTGIAAAAAILLAAEGARIFVVSRTADHADALAERVRAAGGTADAMAADLTDEAEVEAAVAACARGLWPDRRPALGRRRQRPTVRRRPDP